MTVRYELKELSVLRERSVGRPHFLGCLERAIAVQRSTGCILCSFKGGPVQLAYQYTRTSFGLGGQRRPAEKPANIVAVVPCQSTGTPVLVQAFSGKVSKHCDRSRQSSAAA